MDRVGLWKHPNLEPNIRLLESCGAGGACRVVSRPESLSSDVKVAVVALLNDLLTTWRVKRFRL